MRKTVLIAAAFAALTALATPSLADPCRSDVGGACGRDSYPLVPFFRHRNPPVWNGQQIDPRRTQMQRGNGNATRTKVREHIWHRHETTSWHVQIHWHKHCEGDVCVTNYE